MGGSGSCRWVEPPVLAWPGRNWHCIGAHGRRDERRIRRPLLCAAVVLWLPGSRRGQPSRCSRRVGRRRASRICDAASRNCVRGRRGEGQPCTVENAIHAAPLTHGCVGLRLRCASGWAGRGVRGGAVRPALRSTAVHVTIGPRTGRGTQEVRGRTGEPGETGAYAFHRELNLHGLLPYGPGTHGGRGGAPCAAPPRYARRTGYRGTPPTRVPRPGTQRGQVRRRAADPPRAASKRVRPRERTTSRTVRIGSRDSGGFSCARACGVGAGAALRARAGGPGFRLSRLRAG